MRKYSDFNKILFTMSKTIEQKQAHSNTPQDEINKFLSERPSWLQSAAAQLLKSGDLKAFDVDEHALLCHKEANGEVLNINKISYSPGDRRDSDEIRLASISNIEGVNRLNPRNSLGFDKQSNISIIYGNNGSGKSGYVRLLKHICGARDYTRGQLLQDVFNKSISAKKAKISFWKNESLSENEWTDQVIYDDLRSVAIFDSAFGKVFMEKDDEVGYEPPELVFLSKLIYVCNKVKEKFEAEEGKYPSKMPAIPFDIADSDGAKWLGRLGAQTSPGEINTRCSFTAENKTALQDIAKRLSEVSPADKAKQLKGKKDRVDGIITFFENHLEKIDEKCRKVIQAKKEFKLKKEVAETAAKNVFNSAELNGIGTDTWKELWDTARKYSEAEAYQQQTFPVVENRAVCVLCMQSLSDDAKKRFVSFEAYMKGATQKAADEAKKFEKDALDALPEMSDEGALKTKIAAADIQDEEIVEEITDTATIFRDRKIKLQSSASEDALANIAHTPPWIEKVRKISQKYEESANKYEQDAIKENRDELKKRQKNLQAKQWLSEQKSAIEKEVNRLQYLEKIKKSKNFAGTTALSKKKGALAETLITDSFIKRFNEELNYLSASKIQVELKKTGNPKGKALHSIRLKCLGHESLKEVLSEGEFRIVSIAAFLADATGKKTPAPLVFDDPTSSLDQNYEKAVAKRLLKIASDRQVIVFTHRIPFLRVINEAADKAAKEVAKEAANKCEIIWIRATEFGTGNPSDVPLFVKSVQKALSCFRKRITDAEGTSNPETISGLCAAFRIILERMIEKVLLSDIVCRDRKDIHSRNLPQLAKISKDGYSLLDTFMDIYSRYVHPESDEDTGEPPSLEELKEDCEKLEKWRKDFVQ